MSESLTKDAIIVHLEALSKWLNVKAPGRCFELLVVGGAALALSGLKDSTFDIDVIRPTRLDPVLERAVAAVARSRGLPERWLSTSVADVFAALGLPRSWPDYFDETGTAVEVGGNLTIRVAGRQALISTKLLASNPSVAKHTEDLTRLRPSLDEIRQAVDFVRSVDPGDLRRDDLVAVLARLGFDGAALAGWPA
jgi:hypothetical protein